VGILQHDENFGAAKMIGDAGDRGTPLNLSDINVVKNRNESQASTHMLGVASQISHNVMRGGAFRDHGDRFIPCRSENSKYELQYQHEEHLLLNMKGANKGSMMVDTPIADTNLNTSSDSLGNISQQSGTSSGSGTNSMSPGDQNVQVYNNLLHS
jgi:hypothetical protein